MKILYLILLIMASVFYPMFKDDLSFLLLLSLIIFPVLMLVMLTIVKARLAVKIVPSCDCTRRAKPFTLKIIIRNRTIFPVSSCSIVVLYKLKGDAENKKYTVSVPLKALTEETVAIKLCSEHCGVIESKIKRLRISDFIGLFSFGIRCEKIRSISVLPSVYQYKTIVDNDTSWGEAALSDLKSGNDTSEVFSLREYRDGDRQNRIHWKLSSRGDDIIVKELSEPVSSSVLLIPDSFVCQNKSECDEVYDIFTSIAQFLIDSGVSFDTILSNGNVFSEHISDAEELEAFLFNLVSQNDTVSLAEQLLSSEPCQRYPHIILIAPRERPAVTDGIAMFADRTSFLCTSKSQFQANNIGDVVIYNVTPDSLPNDFVI